jgi:hypothetical protein
MFILLPEVYPSWLLNPSTSFKKLRVWKSFAESEALSIYQNACDEITIKNVSKVSFPSVLAILKMSEWNVVFAFAKHESTCVSK